MRNLAAICIASCPRYLDDGRKLGFHDVRPRGEMENLVLQAEFWSSVRTSILGRHGLGLELRWVAHAMSGRTDLWILLIDPIERIDRPALTDADAGDLARQLINLLPKEYACRATPLIGKAIQPSAMLPDLGRQSQGDHLTSRSDETLPPFESYAIRRRRMPLQVPASMFVEANFLEEPTKDNPDVPPLLMRVPHPQEVATSAAMANPCVVAYLAELRDDLPDRRRLCADLQTAAPAVLSISMHAVDLRDLAGDRPAARSYQRWSQRATRRGHTLLGDANRAGNTYSRYWLPPEMVCGMSVQVVARGRAARQLAYAFCSAHGGSDALQVEKLESAGVDKLLGRRPKLPGSCPAEIDRLLAPLNFYALYHIDADLAESDAQTWARQQGARFVADEWPDRGSFLAAMGHLYTVEESNRLIRLPFGDEAGLPGVETHVVAPFYASPQSRVSVERVLKREANSELRGLMRLGVLQPPGTPLGVASNDSKANEPSVVAPADPVRPGDSAPAPISQLPGARWHTMPAANLTKHALIVGSTGSGKTTTMQFLLQELDALGVDFTVIEPIKTEYSDLLQKLSARTVNAFDFTHRPKATPGLEYLRFDPMRVQPGVTVARHISYLRSCFEAAMPLEGALGMLLMNAMQQYYSDGINLGGCNRSMFHDAGGVFIRPVPLTEKEQRVFLPLHDSERTWIRPTDLPKLPNAEWGVFPSLRTFALFVFSYLDRELLTVRAAAGANSGSGLREILEAFRRRFELILQGPLGISCALADALVLDLLARNPYTIRAAESFKDPANGSKPFGSPGDDRVVYLGGRPDFEKSWNPAASLFGGRTVVELDAIADNEQKSLVMAFLLTFLYERRQVQDMIKRGRLAAGIIADPPWDMKVDNKPRHVLIVEEAHRLLSKSNGPRGEDTVGVSGSAKAVQMFTDMLAEIRAYGQSIFVVEQIPSKLASEAIKNTNLKLMHRLTSSEDREYMGRAMNLVDAQIRFVNTLRPGQVIAYEESEDQPFMLTIPGSEDWKHIF